MNGLCYSPIKTIYSNCEGIVTGFIIGDIETNICSGTLIGTLTNYTFNQQIPVGGIVTGTLENHTNYVESDQYNKGYPAGYIIGIKTIYGDLYNLEPLLTEKTHVLDIKDVNTLGRKELSEENPILGKDLNKTTKNLDENEQYGLEKWQLVEYITNYNRPIPVTQELPDDINVRPTPQANNRLLLASPRYIRSINNLRSDPESVPEPEEVLLPEYESNEEETYIYCSYINDDMITIKKYKTTDVIDNNNLLIGPLDSLNNMIYDILTYINNSSDNLTYEQISEYEYKLIKQEYFAEPYYE